MKEQQLRILLLAGITDVIVAGVLLVLIITQVINLPVFVPLLLIIAGIGIVIGALVAGARESGGTSSQND